MDAEVSWVPKYKSYELYNGHFLGQPSKSSWIWSPWWMKYYLLVGLKEEKMVSSKTTIEKRAVKKDIEEVGEW